MNRNKRDLTIQNFNKKVKYLKILNLKILLIFYYPEKIPMEVRWLAGLSGSTISSFICSPLDLIKVRLQTSVKIISFKINFIV